MKKYSVAIIMIFVIGVSLFGTTYYVSNSGNDNNIGTEEYPFEHIQYAIEVASDFDDICILDGQYYENIDINEKSLNIYSYNNDPNECILYHHPDTSPPNTILSASGGSYGANFYINLTGIGFDGSNISADHEKACFLYSIDTSISNCKISNLKNGIHIVDPTNYSRDNNHIIENNEFNNMEETSLLVSKSNSITIVGNSFDTSKRAISCIDNSTSTINMNTILNFEIYGVRIYNTNTYLTDESMISNNFMFGDESNFYLDCCIYILKNVNIKVMNNTYIGNNDSRRVIKLDGSNYGNFGNVNIINNIMYNFEIIFELINIGTYTDALVNYNCINNGSIPAELQPTQDYNIYIDPLFNNGEYTLFYEDENNHSPCIDEADPDTDGDGVSWLYDEEDRDIDGSRKDMGCYPYLHEYDTKHFDEGVHWISFPILTQYDIYEPEDPPSIHDQIYQQAYYENGDDGLLQDESGNTINSFESILGNRYGTDMSILPNGPNWYDWDVGFDNMLFRHEGYKIQVAVGADPTNLIVGDGVSAERLPADHVIAGSMEPGEYHWIGYWLLEPQNIVDAFGFGTQNDLWQYVEKVKSEDWYYNKRSIIRGDDPLTPVSWSTENKTLEYGKTYMVWFKDQSIENFEWYTSSTVDEPKEKATSESFTYTEKADYEVIDVVNIPSNVIEIGVFEDEVCVGAVVVEDTCAQILVYSDNANRDPIPFTFEVVTGRGFSTPIKDYQVLDLETGKFESKSIISGRQEYSVIRFDDEDEPEDNILSTPQLHGNYPNPFNPTTTIEFSLVQTSQFVTLEIFNIKGQKVKTLYKGIAEEGKHSVTWEGKDTNGKSVSTGIYFYKLKTGKKEISRKMLLLK